MSWTSHVFAGPDEPVSAVRQVIEVDLGGSFTFPPEPGEDPYLVHGRADVYVGRHDYEDDMIAFDDGSWVPLHSQYPHCIEVSDLDKDIERQQALACKVFDALKAAGTWKLVYIDDMQRVVDRFEPGQGAGNSGRQ